MRKVTNERKTVIAFFSRTDNIVKPWLDAGYKAIIVDIQHPPGENWEGNLCRVGADILTYLPPIQDYAFACAFPPCTDLAVSGARWFQSKGLKKLADALLLVDRARELCEWTGAPWFFENPVSTISSYYRKPDYTFDPCDYAGYLDDNQEDAYTKRTCLWTGGGIYYAR